MPVYPISVSRISEVARLMSIVQPEVWSFQGAFDRLGDIRNTSLPVGWFLGEDVRRPYSWILCSDCEERSSLSIECLGCDATDGMHPFKRLHPLMLAAESYARTKGYRILSHLISSENTSCHGAPLEECWEALRDLQSYGCEILNYFTLCGFKPAGLLSNCYGINHHAILLVKQLM